MTRKERKAVEEYLESSESSRNMVEEDKTKRLSLLNSNSATRNVD